MPSRIHLGASRLEHLNPRVLNTFLDKSWIHLGDQVHKSDNGPMKEYSVSCFAERFRKQVISIISNKTFQKLFRSKEETKPSELPVTEMYSRTNFQYFFYRKGDRLPFDDSSIDFIFSEHFLEHLFFDESVALLRECHRILNPFGVIRACVPDADLRTYKPPEPVGFPDSKLPFEHPDKHKTRWSVYSLVEAIKITGFEAIPLHYCNRAGEYIKVNPADNVNSYEGCPDQELIFEFSYINRIDSLIVDGIKK